MWVASVRVVRSTREKNFTLIFNNDDEGRGWMEPVRGMGNRLIRINHVGVSVERWDYCRRSSTSGLSKGRGAPQISRGMTRFRVALGIILAAFGSYWEIASFRTILSILKTIGKYLMGSTIWCRCLLCIMQFFGQTRVSPSSLLYPNFV